jgi:hypothetical protein
MKRTQALSQNHAARTQHQQQLQPFGMPTGIPPASNQQQQYDSNQAHIPSAFPNMGGIPNGNPNQPAARPGAQNIHVQRQLDPMNMAQPQNGPIKFTQQQLQQHQLMHQQRQQQQQFQAGGMNNHSSPADIFSSPGMSNELLRRPSPHPGNPQQVPPVQGSQPQQLPMMVGPNGARVPISPQEMAQRINILKSQMASQEQLIKQLQIQHNSVKGTPQEGQLLAKVKDLTMEYNKRRDYVQRFTQGHDTFRCVPLQTDCFFILFRFFC